jgi:putative transposase
MLTVIDEFTRCCLTIVVARKLNADDVLHCLTELFATAKAGACLAWPDRREDALYRTRQSMGERVQ